MTSAISFGTKIISAVDSSTLYDHQTTHTLESVDYLDAAHISAPTGMFKILDNVLVQIVPSDTTTVPDGQTHSAEIVGVHAIGPIQDDYLIKLVIADSENRASVIAAAPSAVLIEVFGEIPDPGTTVLIFLSKVPPQDS